MIMWCCSLFWLSSFPWLGRLPMYPQMLLCCGIVWHCVVWAWVWPTMVTVCRAVPCCVRLPMSYLYLSTDCAVLYCVAWSVLRCAVLCCVAWSVLCCVVLCCVAWSVLCSAVLCCVAWSVLCCAVLLDCVVCAVLRLSVALLLHWFSFMHWLKLSTYKCSVHTIHCVTHYADADQR